MIYVSKIMEYVLFGDYHFGHSHVEEGKTVHDL